MGLSFVQVLNGLRDLIQSIYDAPTLSTQEAKYNNLLNMFGENRNGAFTFMFWMRATSSRLRILEPAQLRALTAGPEFAALTL